MIRIVCLMACLMLSVSMSAQTQQGYVKYYEKALLILSKVYDDMDYPVIVDVMKSIISVKSEMEENEQSKKAAISERN
ncbi:MAG: hypothetical protein IJV44_10900 [Prevotella sp.]|nr:hypothetical protein [Prevotella sp.]